MTVGAVRRRQSRIRTDAEIRKWAEFVNAGHTYKEAGKEFNVTHDAIYSGMKKLGLIEVRNPNRRVDRQPGEGRNAQIYEYAKTHTSDETASHFKMNRSSVHTAISKHRQDHDLPAVTYGRDDLSPEVVVKPKPDRQLYFLARALDEEIVKEIGNTGEISGVSRLALVLTHEIRKGK